MASTNQVVVAKQTQSASQMMVRAQMFWASRSQQQKIYLGAGLAVMVAAAIFFGQMISAPDYKPLMSGLEAADAQTIAAQLAAKKIPYEISKDGTSISVPADQVDAARLEVASHDAPHSGRIGFEIFDKVSWGQTEFDEKVNYQRALEGELERTIQTMSNVKSARVHLVMATDSVFMDRERGAKASVTLHLRHGSLSREEIAAITRLVAGAVDELKPEDVALVDADSNQTLGNKGGGAGGSDIEQELTRRLMATLTPVVGADRIHASVNVEYETSSSEQNEEKYDPTVSVPLSMQKSEEITTSGKGAGGVPGTSSNVARAGAKPNAAQAVTEAGQSSKTENATYGVNRMTRRVVEPAGGIRRLTAAVLVDDAVERRFEGGKWVETHHGRSPEELKMISDLAQAAIGFDGARGDVVSVQNLAFDRPPANDGPPLNLVERAEKSLSNYAAAGRYGALLGLFVLVYLLMFRPIQKRALAMPDAAQLVLAARGKELEPAALPEPAAGAAQHALQLRKQLADFVKDEPESSTTAVRAWLQEGAQ
ncbi:MAG TPA: flagellar basal-body MS-ring/collar protein FliF [Acidobacteriaceae bacterium]